jgi:hypothetical protein
MNLDFRCITKLTSAMLAWQDWEVVQANQPTLLLLSKFTFAIEPSLLATLKNAI